MGRLGGSKAAEASANNNDMGNVIGHDSPGEAMIVPRRNSGAKRSLMASGRIRNAVRLRCDQTRVEENQPGGQNLIELRGGA